MALLHRADLRPTKLQLLAAWLPGRPWYRGSGDDIERVAACRFDDPAGAVGIEIMLVRAGSAVIHHVPLTYRDAPLPGGDAWLIGTCEHSVLGRRWVYDACGDPVYAVALANAIFSGTGEAAEFIEIDGQLERRTPAMTLTGSGSTGSPVVHAVQHVVDGDPTRIQTDTTTLTIFRTVPPTPSPTTTTPTLHTLTARHPNDPTPTLLATAQPPTQT